MGIGTRTVTAAGNGREAWSRLQTENFDLIITDYQMPEMDGEELCRQIRQDPHLTNVPIILLSGKGLELNLAQLREELGIHEVFFKPFSPAALVAAVQTCLQQTAAVG